MTPPYLANTTTAGSRHAKASAAKRLRSNGYLGQVALVRFADYTSMWQRAIVPRTPSLTFLASYQSPGVLR